MGADVDVVVARMLQPCQHNTIGKNTQRCAFAVGKAVRAVLNLVVAGVAPVAPVHRGRTE